MERPRNRTPRRLGGAEEGRKKERRELGLRDELDRARLSELLDCTGASDQECPLPFDG